MLDACPIGRAEDAADIMGAADIVYQGYQRCNGGWQRGFVDSVGRVWCDEV